MKEITELADIRLLVNSFYGRIREDELLAPVFHAVVKDNWPKHLEKMYSFWQTVLLQELTYRGSPFMPHAHLPVEKEHFDRWLTLFRETLDLHFTGIKAEEAKWRAEKMAEMFHAKIQYYRTHPTKPLI